MSDYLFAWHDLSIDQQLMGLVFNNPHLLHKILDAGLCDEYFYDAFALKVFKAMIEAHHHGLSIDDKNIPSLLGQKHEVEWQNFELRAPITANLEYFLQPFLEQHAARVVEKNNATNRHLSPMELQRLNSSMVDEIMSGLQQQRTMMDITADWTKRAKDFIDGKVVYLPTHIKSLNDTIDGWMPGALYIVGARPKVGKTTLALNFAYHLAMQHGARVIYGTIEQTDVELADKFISLHSRVPTWKIKKGQCSLQEQDRLEKARDEIAKSKLEIWGNWQGRWDIIEPRLVSAMKEKHKPQFIVLDHLHIMKPDSKTPISSIEGITSLTGSAKVFAQTHNVPVLMCSQFNRESDKETRPPRLADLRGSGSIEQDADVVMFVHKNNFNDMNDQNRDLIVAANRHGNQAKIRLVGNLAISELKGDDF